MILFVLFATFTLSISQALEISLYPVGRDIPGNYAVQLTIQEVQLERETLVFEKRMDTDSFEKITLTKEGNSYWDQKVIPGKIYEYKISQFSRTGVYLDERVAKVTIPVDINFTDNSSLTKHTSFEAPRIYLSKTSPLYLQGHNAFIKAVEFFVDGTVQALNDPPPPGGAPTPHFGVEVLQAIGKLTLRFVAGKGSEGLPGTPGATGKMGSAGQPALEPSVFPDVCIRPPTNGEPGGRGSDGGTGQPGGLGGYISPLLFYALHSDNLQLTKIIEPGLGGNGGPGGPGGMGGLGGPPGSRRPHSGCPAANPGPQGPNGNTGPTGPQGPKGTVKQICFKLGDTVEGHCD